MSVNRAIAACAIAGAIADKTDFLRRIEALAAGHRPQRRLMQEGQSASPALAPLDLRGVPQDQRAQYRGNYEATVAARAAFEKELVAFMRTVFPTWSPHDVRVMFRDL